MAFTYDPIFAADPSNPANVAQATSITLFDPNDPSKAPVTITDVTGSPLANPVTVNANGWGPSFQHATLDRVGWFGAGFTGYFTSYEGMRNEAKAAREAAQAAGATAGAEAAAGVASVIADAEAARAAAAASATAAANAAGLVGAPADSAIEQAIKTAGRKTAAALSAVYVGLGGTAGP